MESIEGMEGNLIPNMKGGLKEDGGVWRMALLDVLEEAIWTSIASEYCMMRGMPLMRLIQEDTDDMSIQARNLSIKQR